MNYNNKQRTTSRRQSATTQLIICVVLLSSISISAVTAFTAIHHHKRRSTVEVSSWTTQFRCRFVSTTTAKRTTVHHASLQPNDDDDDSSTTNASSSSNPALAVLSYFKESKPSDRSNDIMVGEEAAVYNWDNERWLKFGDTGWVTFFAAVATILTFVAVLWVYPVTGYADDLQHTLDSVANGNPHIVTLCYGILFPIVHSGLASLRPYGEKIVGARIWRVIFAFPSLCLSYSWIVYFIAHVHDGYELYDISSSTIVHGVAWLINCISFLFLYPTVFNLKEVAAVETPVLHLWETGIIRITRHPQYVGQCMWSFAHLAMVGTTFSALTMALLVGHHYFACWNGDRRLYNEHGEKFVQIQERTSIVPFAAILDGRQVLPSDYYKELLRAPYAFILAGSIGAYFAHPYMQAGAALVTNTGWVPGGIFDSVF